MMEGVVFRRLFRVCSAAVVATAHALHFTTSTPLPDDETVENGSRAFHFAPVNSGPKFDSESPQEEGRPRAESITSTTTATAGVSYLRVLDVDAIDPVALTYVAVFSHMTTRFINNVRARGSFVEEVPRSAVPFPPSADLHKLRDLRQTVGDDLVAVHLGDLPAVELIPISPQPRPPEPHRP